jgi:hypothetical protein
MAAMTPFEQWTKDKGLKLELEWEYFVCGVKRVAQYYTAMPLPTVKLPKVHHATVRFIVVENNDKTFSIWIGLAALLPENNNG